MSNRILDGAQFSNCRFIGADFTECSLQGAYFGNCDLSNAHLVRAELGGASPHFVKFVGADLTEARMYGGSFVGSDFTSAILDKALLQNAYLAEAVLRDASLRATDFQNSRLLGTVLDGSQCESVVLNRTVIAAVDVAPFCDVEIDHRGRSIVDHRTIVRSKKHPRLNHFLRATGMPEIFIDYLVECALALDPLEEFNVLQSVILSYGGPDVEFARRIRRGLEEQGVRVFFFELDATFGDALDELMYRGVNEHDRVVVLCSQKSLHRSGVLNEITECLRREARGGGRHLLPVALDKYVFDEWTPTPSSLKERVLDRVVADFTLAVNDQTQFLTQLGRLVSALRVGNVSERDSTGPT